MKKKLSKDIVVSTESIRLLSLLSLFEKLALEIVEDYPNNDDIRFRIGSVGLVSEVGELLGLYKKFYHYKGEPTKEDWCKEMGDCLFYLTAIFDSYRLSFLGHLNDSVKDTTLNKLLEVYRNLIYVLELDVEQIISLNREKLTGRHKETFTEYDKKLELVKFCQKYGLECKEEGGSYYVNFT